MADTFQMGAIDFNRFYDVSDCETILSKYNFPASRNHLSQMKTIGGVLGFQFNKPEEGQTVGYSRLQNGFSLMLFNGSRSVDVEQSVQMLDDLHEGGVIQQYILYSENGILVS